MANIKASPYMGNILLANHKLFALITPLALTFHETNSIPLRSPELYHGSPWLHT